MSINPDIAVYIGYGPQVKTPDTEMEQRYLIPTSGMLRFVERAPEGESEPSGRKLRILQQYQWSSFESEFDWYDVPLVSEQ